MTVSCIGITGQLEELTKLSEAVAFRMTVVRDEIHRQIAGPRSRRETMNLIIDELWRRYEYRRDPLEERYVLPRAGDLYVDVEGACLFVVAVAKGFGIRCRFVMARYDRASWTLYVAYENEEGLWLNLSVLRQKTDQVPNELVMGPIPGDG